MTDNPVAKASGDFKLSITRALADQLLSQLSDLVPAPLATENVAALQQRPGIYELFLLPSRDGAANDDSVDDNQTRVYVGKATKDLKDRLNNHRRKLSGRTGISLSHVHFKCLYVDEDLDAAAPETLLIRNYKNQGTLPWNTNGFGNNDPGKNRDKSLVKGNHFDAIYPASIDLTLDKHISELGKCSVRELLSTLKPTLPFTLRFEDRTTYSKEYDEFTVDIPRRPLTVREAISLVIDALPAGWQATALPGYVILYHEISEYKSARFLWRKVDGQTQEQRGDNLRAKNGENADKEPEEPTED